MTLYSTLDTLFSTIINTYAPVGSIASPTTPRVTGNIPLPTIQYQEISETEKFILASHAPFSSEARISVRCGASTHAGLLTLKAQVAAVLNHNWTVFQDSFPIGKLMEGHEDDPETFWDLTDWRIWY